MGLGFRLSNVMPWPMMPNQFSTHGIFLNIHYFPSQIFLMIWMKMFFENFNIYENNIISVELAKGSLLRYFVPSTTKGKTLEKKISICSQNYKQCIQNT
jgi:hypothetical protein